MSEDNKNQDDVQNRKRHVDEVSGVETTGHEWDGLRELNNPAPRWWLWVFYACCIWSFGYWIVYPAWPTISGHTPGIGERSQYKELAASQAEIRLRQAGHLKDFHRAGFAHIMDDPALYSFAVAGGASAFKDNCATCHGTGGAGAKGYPNLNDDDWIWGGTVEDIYTTLLYGIRADHQETRVGLMQAYGRDGLLKRAEISAVADLVAVLHDQGMQEAHPGYAIFQQNCASCHGTDGKGLREFGAPNLADAIWLYGGDRETIHETLYYGRAGVMPHWSARLDDDTIRQLAIYVHSLGGGE